MLRFFVLLLIVLFGGGVQTSYALFNTAKVTIKVVDESGYSIEGAKVGVGFEFNNSSGTSSSSTRGTTNSEGCFSASAKTNGHISFRVEKVGYYQSSGSFDFDNLEKLLWKPWNPELKIVLRNIENPVPMYAINTQESKIEIPVIGEKVGFDLIVSDWVAPYGEGLSSDFIFTLQKNYKSRRDYDFRLKIDFSSTFDGIQKVHKGETGSVFILPRFAPIDGYESGFISVKKWHPGQAPEVTWSPENHYVFRVRSEVENEKHKRSMYGKIIGGISIGQQKQGTAFIRFKYYLNPDYTRNLEYDPKQNLFGVLPSLEQVGIK